LSSIACAADHIDHTRTQAPYATLAALVSAVIGYLPLGFGLSPYVSIVLGLLALVLVLRIIGKDPELG
jgi:Na+/H+ antiporter NhaC